MDHSKGKWFAPGEALPPGFIITAHPEGHTAPQEGHMMSDKARLRGQGGVVSFAWKSWDVLHWGITGIAV